MCFAIVYLRVGTWDGVGSDGRVSPRLGSSWVDAKEVTRREQVEASLLRGQGSRQGKLGAQALSPEEGVTLELPQGMCGFLWLVLRHHRASNRGGRWDCWPRADLSGLRGLGGWGPVRIGSPHSNHHSGAAAHGKPPAPHSVISPQHHKGDRLRKLRLSGLRV